ncbi:hypothetical protein EWI07_05140 [Sporolactobacillus sp. THM7-4]|nr:hypothetical protein EWI07_05140 [Sporolactobacillus sp. THM7-4]
MTKYKALVKVRNKVFAEKDSPVYRVMVFGYYALLALLIKETNEQVRNEYDLMLEGYELAFHELGCDFERKEKIENE